MSSPVHPNPPRLGSEGCDLSYQDLDALTPQSVQRALDLLRSPPAHHQPEERGLEQVLRLAIDEHHPIPTAEKLP